MNFKGQGALEYLLMIGAGIAIAAIVLYFVLSAGQSATCESFKSNTAGLCAAKPNQDLCSRLGNIDNVSSTPDVSGNECEWNVLNDQCVVKAGIDWAVQYPEHCST